MRFRDLLRSGNWSLSEAGSVFDRHAMSRRVKSCIAQIRSNRGPHGGYTSSVDGITIFGVTSATEALTAYLTASELGLRAAVISIRNAPRLIRMLEPDAVNLVVLPKGRRLPNDCQSVAYVSIDSNMASASNGYSTDSSDQLIDHGMTNRPGAMLLFCTSGSTGTPKVVVCDESRLLNNSLRVADYLELSSSDRTLCPLPITMMFGLSTLLCSLTSSGHIEMAETANSAYVVDTMARSGLNVLPLLGDWAVGIARQWRGRIGRLPVPKFVTASDRVLKVQAESLLSVPDEFWNNYGQTEAGPRLLALRVSRVNSLDDYCFGGVLAPGRPIDSRIQLRISRTSGESPDIGELHYSSPFAMIGYLRPDGSVEKREEWLKSGDLFRRSSSGLYQWVGRIGQLIKRDGVVVDVNRIVDRLLGHERIGAACFTKTEYGEVVLYVESSDRSGKVKELAESIMSNEPMIRRCTICIVPSLPRTTSGKIDREALVSCVQ